ncbi:MAG: DNA repair protein [Gammaproteobacteria bacterium]|nr:MAG: DNA repair protein [Gammaproteobacteria bacterium]
MKAVIQKSLLVMACVYLAACQSAYYNAMEKVGIHKRDILVDRVEKARDAQVEAKETFKSALEEFQTVLNVKRTSLQDQYDAISSEYETASESATEVTERIDAIENVAQALFKEWQGELEQYSNRDLKAKSQRKLNATQRKYKKLMTAMRRAENKMQPVLSALRDQVLYLKHNLNAQAISSLKGELSGIQGNVTRLVREMEKSIAESEAFIEQLER